VALATAETGGWLVWQAPLLMGPASRLLSRNGSATVKKGKRMTKLPVTRTTADGDQIIALSHDSASPPSIASTLSQLTAAMQKAVVGMDDLSLEVDASPDWLKVRLRAYKHRNGSG
jgi:hypothetical protein